MVEGPLTVNGRQPVVTIRRQPKAGSALSSGNLSDNLLLRLFCSFCFVVVVVVLFWVCLFVCLGAFPPSLWVSGGKGVRGRGVGGGGV